MLTKSDLQAIKTLIKDEVDPLKSNVSGLRTDGGGLKEDMKSLKGDMKKIGKDIKTIIDVFDKRDVRLQKRVAKIETHLGIAG